MGSKKQSYKKQKRRTSLTFTVLYEGIIAFVLQGLITGALALQTQTPAQRPVPHDLLRQVVHGGIGLLVPFQMKEDLFQSRHRHPVTGYT